MPTKLFIARDGKTLGPFPEEKVKDLYEKGKLEPHLELWAEGGFSRKTTLESYFGPKTSVSGKGSGPGKSADVPKEKTLYVSIDGKVKGPYPESKIRSMLDAGEIQVEDHVCGADGDAKWVEAGEYFGIDSTTTSIEEDEADTYVGDEDDFRNASRPLKAGKKKKAQKVEFSPGDTFGTPDVAYILRNLNDGTFVKRFTGAMTMVLGVLGALLLVFVIGMFFYGALGVGGPAFIIIGRIFVAISLIYPTFFFAVSFVSCGLQIFNLKPSKFTMTPIASIIVDTIANNCLLFGLFLAIPSAILATAIGAVFQDGVAAMTSGASAFGLSIASGVGPFFLLKFWKELVMVLFFIGQDVEAIKLKAEEMK